jgi:L-lactate utilization protein LutB
MDLQKTMDSLKRRGFDVSYFETGEEAARHVSSQLKGEVVGFGGSTTCDQIGIFDMLAADNTPLWHWKDVSHRERWREFTAYICSVNALSETGEMVNIDGTGNRLANTLYGPKKLFLIVGVNKVAPDLESAIYRARNVAAPLNAQRFKLSTPCTADGKCHDCDSPQRICGSLVIYMRKMKGFDSTEVVLVNQDLGM